MLGDAGLPICDLCLALVIIFKNGDEAEGHKNSSVHAPAIC